MLGTDSFNDDDDDDDDDDDIIYIFVSTPRSGRWGLTDFNHNMDYKRYV